MLKIIGRNDVGANFVDDVSVMGRGLWNSYSVPSFGARREMAVLSSGRCVFLLFCVVLGFVRACDVVSDFFSDCCVATFT